MDSKTTGRTKRRSFTRRANAVLLSCTAIIALAPGLVAAQEAASGSATVLQTITVEGNGGDDDSKTIVANRTTGAGKIKTDILDTPASVSVITAKEVQQRGAQTTEQVLQYTAGVATHFYGSDDRFDYFKIRGFDAYQYRDGLTLGDPFGGIREEPYAYERIEVLKGASSTAFGVSDPGGSVNYVTKLPKTEKFGEAYVTGGSYAKKEAGVDFGDNITSDGTLSYRFTGKVRDANAEYDYSRDDEKFFMGGLTWRPTDATSLSVVYDHLNKDGVPGSAGHPVGTNFDRSRYFGEPDYNYRGVNRNTLSVLFDHDFGSGLSFSSNARYSKTNSDFGYAFLSQYSNPGTTTVDRYYFGDDTALEEFIIDAKVQYEANFDSIDSTTLVGVEYYNRKNDNKLYYDLTPTTIDWTNPVFAGPPNYASPYESTLLKQKTKAIYVQQDINFSDKIIASVGLRNDWLDLNKTDRVSYTAPVEAVSDADLSEFTKRFGLTYKFTDELAAYISYAESVAPPAIGTEPERGEQYELGVKYRPDDFPALFSASVYDLTKKNITVTSSTPPYLRSTIGEVNVRGIDLEAKAEVTNNLSLTAAYSYLKTDIVDDGSANKGNEMGLVPRQMASLWANYALEGNGERGDMTFGFGGRYMGSSYTSDANVAKNKSTVVFDAAFTYEVVENTTFEVTANNVFNDKSLINSGGYGIDGGAGAIFYNPGRSFSATLRRTW